MGQQVMGVFASEELALAALRLFRGAGYSRPRLTLLSKKQVPWRKMRSLAQHPVVGPRMGMLKAMLLGALIGGLLAETVGVAWAILAVDLGPVQLFVAAWAWKVGIFIGGFVGVFVFEGQGPEVQIVEPYQEYLARGSLVLAVGVSGEATPEARGILIESGASGVEDVEESLLARAGETPSRRQPGGPPMGWE